MENSEDSFVVLLLIVCRLCGLCRLLLSYLNMALLISRCMSVS